jgi:predicted Zn-dependent protease with MMP-like domain
MVVLKNRVKVEDGILHMKLPEEFKDKIVEVVIKVENEIAKKLLIDTIRIDTTKWKFNREEIYG